MRFTDIKMFSDDDLKIRGVMDDNVNFVAESQLKSRERWEKLVEPFITKEDSDGFWRGEFFGKEMRGAALIYRYTKDEELYAILTEAVKKLLAAQDEKGRISTYSEASEFNGWDMWCRKYVLTGIQHYYRICRDEGFRKEILSALSKHADYIISKIGNGEGQKKITETSSWWGCVNSCTILEPMLELYKETGEKRYFEFAKYIISTGGSSDCDFMELALENKLAPFQYPVVKAYETMSYFEGLLAYYEITGEEKYFTAVKNFVEAVEKTDMTIIGCAGCTHELFDNSSVKQTEYAENIMQETCVTVTWMRISLRMYLETGERKYIDRIEKSGLNALYGGLNTKHNAILNLFTKKYISGMTFDSYSPLYINSRGRGTGGYMEFSRGGSCGCCEAIGACGVALMPLTAVMSAKEGVIVNYLFGGELNFKDKNGKSVKLLSESDYPSENTCRITVSSDGKVNLGMFIRLPGFADGTTINGQTYTGEYADISGEYSDGDVIEIGYNVGLKVLRLNGKVAFTYGAITLGTDEEKFDGDIEKSLNVADNPAYKSIKPQKDELLRIEITLKDGGKITLSDYQSCGKNWLGKRSRTTVWLNSLSQMPCS